MTRQSRLQAAVIAAMLAAVVITLLAGSNVRMRAELDNVKLFKDLYMQLAWSQRRIPETCQEDAVLLGTGDFENGQFEAYRCGPSADDYEGISQ